MVGCARFLGEIFQMRRKFRQAGPQHGIAARPRPCLINGRMPKGERFFRQSRRIFAGGLTPGKKIQRRVAEKDLPLGRFDIFQTWPKLKMCRWHIFLTPRQRKEHSYRPTNTITLLGLMVNPLETGRGAGTVSSQVSTARVHSAEAGSSGRRAQRSSHQALEAT